jgi:hypothetical protein
MTVFNLSRLENIGNKKFRAKARRRKEKRFSALA